MTETDSFKVEIDPKLLKWAIDSAGWKKEELIKALGISEKVFDGWLSGSVNPTMKQLEDISKKTKRPLASFFLPKPPIETPNPKDYRMLPDKKDVFERKTLFAIRKARYLQEISNELSLNINKNLKLNLKRVTISDNPQEIAEKHRELLNLTIERQEKFKSKSHEFYNYLRDVIEDFNVLSFQISMPIKDARGFALADKDPMIIVVNSADDIKPRIFTLIHELGHILLGKTSIDIPSLENQDVIEKWCNDFSAALLMPRQLLVRIFEDYKSKLTDGKILNYISNKYNISKSMFLFNLTKNNYISTQNYKNFLNAVYKEEKKKPSSGGGGQKQDIKCISTLGKKFISLVADNLEKEQITTNDALSYLSIKSRNLDKVISMAGK